MSDPLHLFASKLRLVMRSGAQLKAMCPAHEDKVQSLTFGKGETKPVVFHCHAGCEPDAVLAAAGLTWADLDGGAPQSTEARGVDLSPQPTTPTVQDPQVGMQEPKVGSQARGTIVCTYDYKDEAGQLLNQVVRLEPKSFRQRRPDGNGGWHYNLDGVRRVLYRLPELKRKKAAVIVEGEKDADALWSLKPPIPATTSLGGASAWKEEYAAQLVAAGVKRVAVIPDNDPAGHKYAQRVAADCHRAGLVVRVVSLPGVPDRGDISDFLASAQYPRGDLIRLIGDAAEWDPEAPPVDPTLASRPRAVRLRRPTDLDPTPTSFLIEGLIPLGWFGEIAGRDGRGKTLLAMHIAKSVLTGDKLFDTFEVKKTGPVVMYMLDDPENLVRERIAHLGLLDHPDLYVGTEADLDKQDPNLFPDLAEVCLEVKPVLVIVDALYLFTPENKRSDHDQANSSGAMSKIMVAFDKICAQTGATIALVAHDNKAGTDVAGSQVVRNMAKWILRMALPKQYEKDRQGGRITNDRILELDKLKVASSKAWGMQITTGPQGEAHFEIVPLEQVEKKSRGGKSVEELAERRKEVVEWLRFFLEPGARTSTEVYEAALEAKVKKKELDGADVADAAGVEKIHPEAKGPWLWKIKETK